MDQYSSEILMKRAEASHMVMREIQMLREQKEIAYAALLVISLTSNEPEVKETATYAINELKDEK